MVWWNKATHTVSNTNQGSPEVKKSEMIVWSSKSSKRVPENGFCHLVLRSPPALLQESMFPRTKKMTRGWVWGESQATHIWLERIHVSEKNGPFSISISLLTVQNRLGITAFLQSPQSPQRCSTYCRKLTSCASVMSHTRLRDCGVASPEETREVSKHSLVFGACSVQHPFKVLRYV